MKSMIIYGGVLGFGIGLLFGLAHSSPWPAAVWRASLASLAGAVLLRWWGRVWIRSLREAHHAQHAADAAASTSAAHNVKS
jgi:hypothetical protein